MKRKAHDEAKRRYFISMVVEVLLVSHIIYIGPVVRPRGGIQMYWSALREEFCPWPKNFCPRAIILRGRFNTFEFQPRGRITGPICLYSLIRVSVL